jgi:hypothetical protein
LKTLISALFTLFLLVLIVAMAIHIYTMALQIQEEVDANVQRSHSYQGLR